MSRFVVEYLTTNRHGGLEDREVVVRADSAEAAKALVAARYPQAAVHYAEAVQ
jgi:hypothetical protein